MEQTGSSGAASSAQGGAALGASRRWRRGRLVRSLGLASLLVARGGTAGEPVALEPCSVLSPEEAAGILKGPVSHEGSGISYRGTVTGGTCIYRLRQRPAVMIDLRVDATPTGAQRRRFETGLRSSGASELPGPGDRAYADLRWKGAPAMTFLRGDVLTTVRVHGLDVDDARRVAELVAPRLPAWTDEPAPAPAAAPARGSGTLDPALVGSWFLTQPDGRSLATLRVERDGRFFMTLLAGNRRQSGRIDAEAGVLHLYPERGGRDQTLQYRIVDRNQMEWTDQGGRVTVVRRQSR